MKAAMLWLVLILAAGNSIAQESDTGGRERRGPPAEALEACAAASNGEACAFTTRRGDSREGVCMVGRDEALVCGPANGERQRRGPPAVALEACSAAIEGDACSFASREGTQLQGSCAAHGDKPLACRPERRKEKEPDAT